MYATMCSGPMKNEVISSSRSCRKIARTAGSRGANRPAILQEQGQYAAEVHFG